MAVVPPPAPLWGFATWSFVTRLEHAARGADITATSWYRNPRVNAEVGGDPFSQHLVGWAVDAVGPDSSGFAKRCRVAGLTAVIEASHVHVQLFPKGILRALLGG
jgi:hypothetical protein